MREVYLLVTTEFREGNFIGMSVYNSYKQGRGSTEGWGRGQTERKTRGDCLRHEGTALWKTERKNIAFLFLNFCSHL